MSAFDVAIAVAVEDLIEFGEWFEELRIDGETWLR
jgi:hypothetical protein